MGFRSESHHPQTRRHNVMVYPLEAKIYLLDVASTDNLQSKIIISYSGLTFLV